MFNEHYDKWRQARFNRIVEHYGRTFWRHKTVLEVGCGFGDLGNAFSNLGSVVVCQDARPEHIKFLKEKHPHLSAYVYDLNNGLGTEASFDVILHTGVLYHLNDYIQPIIDCCSRCEHLILETEVSDSSDPNYCLYIDEHKGVYDKSFTGKGNRPSPAAVERVLKEQNFSYERVLDGLDVEFHSYSWKMKNTGKWKNGQRALWFCQRKGE